MKFTIAGKALLAAVAVAAIAGAQSPMQSQQGTPLTFTGTVIDVSCKIVNNAGGADHVMCAQTCADKGQPLALLAADSTFYLPVNSGMGTDGENKRLRPFAEQRVSVTGRVIKRAGMNAIVIERIARAS